MQHKQAWIVRGTGEHQCQLDAGMLSIKCMFNGGVRYETPDGRYWVDDAHYLILNHGQAYSMYKPADVKSVCVFFPEHWASDILRTYIESDEILLDDPLHLNTVNFFETVQAHDEVVSPYMQIIKAMPSTEPTIDGAGYEEFLRDLVAAMLQSQRNILQSAEQLPEARRATRLELLRRLRLARDYIHASYYENLSIDILATVAGLSPYHFIRKFKSAFGETPHHYLRRVRLNNARDLLLNTRQPITEICYDVGFQSLGSFSSLFQKHHGLSPRQFRQAHRQSTQF